MSEETTKFVEGEGKFTEGKDETSCLGGCMGDCAQNCVTQKELEGMVEDVMTIKTKQLEEKLCKKIDALSEKAVTDVCLDTSDCDNDLAIESAELVDNGDCGKKISIKPKQITPKVSPEIGEYVPDGIKVPAGFTMLSNPQTITFDNTAGCEEVCGTVQITTVLEAEIPEGTQVNNCTLLNTGGSTPTQADKFANRYYQQAEDAQGLVSKDIESTQNKRLCVPAGQSVTWAVGMGVNIAGISPQDANIISHSYNITSDLS